MELLHDLEAAGGLDYCDEEEDAGSMTFDGTPEPEPGDNEIMDLERLLAQKAARDAAEAATKEFDADDGWDAATVPIPFLPLPVHVVLDDIDLTRTQWTFVLVRTLAGRINGILAPSPAVWLTSSDLSLEVGERRYEAASIPGESPGWLYQTVLTMPASQLVFMSLPEKPELKARFPFRAFLAASVRYQLNAAPGNNGAHAAIIRRQNKGLRIKRHHYLARIDFNRVSRHLVQRALRDAVGPTRADAASLQLNPIVDDEFPPSATVVSVLDSLMLEVIKPFTFDNENSKKDGRRSSHNDLLERLSGGLWRPLLVAPAPEVLSPLYIAWPNFKEVLDLVWSQLALCARAPHPIPLKLPPILLAGEPGIGKSAFAVALSRALGFGEVPPLEVDFATATASWVLSGLSSTWDGSKPGLVLDSFLDEVRKGNHIIVGNEIDKADSNGAARHNPLGGLLGLLEGGTACRFQDEFVGSQSPIDASHLNWILTANDLGKISDPILSRVETVVVPVPTHDERIAIGQNIYREFVTKNAWGASFPERLSEEVLERLAGVGNPRELKRALTKALGEAASKGAPCVSVDHVRVQVPRRTIGF